MRGNQLDQILTKFILSRYVCDSSDKMKNKPEPRVVEYVWRRC